MVSVSKQAKEKRKKEGGYILHKTTEKHFKWIWARTKSQEFKREWVLR